MITKFRLLIIALLSIFTIISAVPVLAADCCSGNSTKSALQCGVGGANGGNCQNPADSSKAATDQFNTILTDILNIMTVVAGITAVIMVITAGFRFITSGGNPDRVKSARSALMYAIIGIVVVALAQIIVQFVLDKSVNAGTGTKSGSGTAQSP